MFKSSGKLVDLVIVVVAGLLVSCSVPEFENPYGAEESVRPGDQIGQASLRTAVDESELRPVLYHHCRMRLAEVSEASQEDCLVPIAPRYFLGIGIGESNPEKLDAYWDNLAWEISANGKTIDLDSFGTIDALGGRFWNIVLDNPEFDTYVFDQVITNNEDPSESFGLTLNLIVVEPEAVELAGKADSSLPTLSGDVSSGQNPLYSEEADLDYLLYIPDDYGKDPQREWPLILFLHGSGPRYSLDAISASALLHKLKGQNDFPFIVVSPRAFRGEYEIWKDETMVKAIDLLLEEIQTALAVDQQRIYLTGESSGGNGTWELGLRYTDRFAALAPVMGYVYPFDELPETICDLKDIPVWAFHGAQDDVIPLDAGQGLVDALQECGGNVQFTVYADAGHDIEAQVYTTPELYEWLLSQSLE